MKAAVTRHLRMTLPFEHLKSVWAILIGIAAGSLLGFLSPDVARSISIYGELYLTFLKMCVIPIMITALIPSLARLLQAREAARFIRRIALVFAASLLLVSLVSIAAAAIVKPGHNVSDTARTALGMAIFESESNLARSPADAGTAAASLSAEAESGSLAGLILSMIPANVFSALVDGNNVQILVFSVIFGITLGLFPPQNNENLLQMMEGIFKVFQRIIAFTMYILPFALFCMMAGQVAQTGGALFAAMGKFILVIYIVSLFLMAAAAVVIARKSGKRLIDTLRDLKEPLLVAFGTRNSIATMPSVLEAMADRLQLEKRGVDLVVPLGIVICRYSMVLVFAVSSLFIAQLYYLPIEAGGWLIILLGSVLAAVGSAGMPGIVSFAMLALIMDPLGLPSETAVILLIAMNPVFDPIITTASVHLNCAATVLVVDRDPQPAAGGQSPR